MQTTKKLADVVYEAVFLEPGWVEMCMQHNYYSLRQPNTPVVSSLSRHVRPRACVEVAQAASVCVFVLQGVGSSHLCGASFAWPVRGLMPIWTPEQQLQSAPLRHMVLILVTWVAESSSHLV